VLPSALDLEVSTQKCFGSTTGELLIVETEYVVACPADYIL
jgi:hypothetical protein